jgi:hypothetical protein
MPIPTQDNSGSLESSKNMSKRLTDNTKNDWEIDEKREKQLISLVQTT